MQTPSESGGVAPPWSNGALSSLPGGELLELVYLADVVRWLMNSRPLPFAAAARELHNTLKSRDLPLYLRERSGDARRVEPAETFGIGAPRRRIYSRGIGASDGPVVAQRLPDGVAPGTSAALYWLHHVWGSGRYDETVLGNDAWPASRLAMSRDDAAGLWQPIPAADGVRTFDDLRRFRTGEGGKKWEPQHRAVLLKEYTDRITAGASPTRAQQSLASELGLGSRQAVRNQLNKAQGRQGTRKDDESQAHGWAKGLGARSKVQRIR